MTGISRHFYWEHSWQENLLSTQNYSPGSGHTALAYSSIILKSAWMAYGHFKVESKKIDDQTIMSMIE